MYTQAIHKLPLEPNLNRIRWSGSNCSDFYSYPGHVDISDMSQLLWRSGFQEPSSKRHPELVSGSPIIWRRSWNKFRMTLWIWFLRFIISNANYQPWY